MLWVEESLDDRIDKVCKDFASWVVAASVQEGSDVTVLKLHCKATALRQAAEPRFLGSTYRASEVVKLM